MRRHAIGGATGRKHQSADILVKTGVQQRKTAADIVAVVFAWILDGLADISVGGTMNDEGWREFLERRFQETTIQNVAFDKGTPADRIRVAGR